MLQHFLGGIAVQGGVYLVQTVCQHADGLHPVLQGLAVLLCTGVIKENYIEDICTALIDKMALLFLPAGVSMILYLDVIKAELLPISLTVILSSVIILCSTALVLEMLLRKKEKGGQQ